jgi:predicted phosphodiesterase
VRIGDSEYYDESNGIMRSLSELHRVIVPMEELDAAKEYTVCVRPIIKRTPYFPTTEPVREYTFSFRPVPEKNVRAYHMSDAHNNIQGPVAAAKAFGDIDLLILNGDIIDHSGDPSKFDNIYSICEQLTGGQIPVIFSRGNHDMRGKYAERFAEYTPNANGKTYYTFRLGNIWGILLDCGEDKMDENAEYGHTVCCHAFRQRQTAFLKNVIRNKDREYAEEGITHRLVISHSPFAFKLPDPFDIENEIYAEWCSLLNDEVMPDLMICGHMHRTEVHEKGGERDYLGQPCKTVIGSDPATEFGFAGCGITFGEKEIEIVFTNCNGVI